ncbi:MAG TPA: 2-oxoacid:acceptor oxidoreductase subunit alpha [Candidatus Polarisedimenticolia bacterium]|nr:2-oxoacid:acceptor oxidoreductase subunit alpha [Candidatus Polarisedimenticolia bacterium]
MTPQTVQAPERAKVEKIDRVVVRLAGDSGDGIQLSGSQLTASSAIAGNDLSTLPDFPAEIRAPAGTLPGVSGFQISFSNYDIHTPGDQPDALVAFNPAALKVNISELKPGGLLIVNSDAFQAKNLQKAGYARNPLEDGSLDGFRTLAIPITDLNRRALKESGLGTREMDRSKNFFTLGIIYHVYNRPDDATIRWIESKFAKDARVKEANLTALKAGRAYAEATEVFQSTYVVEPAPFPPGTYRNVMGNSALCLGLVAASLKSGRPLFYAGYPITPASPILHELARYREFGVVTLQAEDEIAAVCAALGGAFGGALAVTGTSGPGIALKSEAMGLGLMVELPMVVINVQRGGPSTGLPTKPEQADLLQAMFGRHGESPLPILAASSSGDCFDVAVEACRVALKYMTPVIIMTDGYLANASEPWMLPSEKEIPDLMTRILPAGRGEYLPYERDAGTLARSWALPGTPGYEHRIGGLEKEEVTGNVSYDPENHERMTHLRAEKVRRIAEELPATVVDGDPAGELLVVGWGSTRGAIMGAVRRKRNEGKKVSWLHLRWINPFPKDLGDILKRFNKVLIPEMNSGQLALLLKATYLTPVTTLSKVQGRPFKAIEIAEKIDELLEG